MAPDKKQGETWTESVILRNNSGMVRDFWFEPDTQSQNPMGSDILVIRQLKFNSDGSEPTAKVMRLSRNEYLAIGKAIESTRRKAAPDAT